MADNEIDDPKRLCILCLQEAIPTYYPHESILSYDCGSCGRFRATEAVVEEFWHRPKMRPALSGVARKFSDQKRPVLLTLDNLADLERTAPSTTKQKSSELLRRLASLSETPGARLSFDISDFPLAYASPSEFLALLKSMHKKDLLETLEEYVRPGEDGGFGEQGFEVELSISAWELIEESERPNHESDRAFVAMWFDQSMNDVYVNGIAPAIEAAGYVPIRIDRVDHNNKIDDEIIAEIRQARFVVANFTSGDDGPRGGVYFEAGFAKGLGLDVIWSARSDFITKVHFDTRQYAHLAWQTPDQLKEMLRLRIMATIGQGPHFKPSNS